MPHSVNFDIGYYEKCSSKCQIVIKEDLAKTEEMSQWRDGGCFKFRQNYTYEDNKVGTSSKLEDQQYKALTEKHEECSSEKIVGYNHP